MAVIVIDTCLAACQVGVADGGTLIASASEPMERGHQERLAPMAAEVMARAGLAFGELSRIAVTIGPGSFTGLRVGLAFAKGLHVAYGAPLVGIGTLAALAETVASDGPVAALIDARRGYAYVQAFNAGHALTAPSILPLAEAAAMLSGLAGWPFPVAGPGARLMEPMDGSARIAEFAAPSVDALSRLADRAAPAEPVRPLYLRPPVARPPDARPTAP